jgi:hypothetical protein
VGTFVFGYISFKLFQIYKNKKENNKLYIKLIKLKKEIDENKCQIEEILNEYIEKEILTEHFYYNNGIFTDKLYRLYYHIDQLEMFYIEEPIYEYGEQIGVEHRYTDKPYQIISDLQSEIGWSEISEDYSNYDTENLREQIANYENKVIYNELAKIQEKTSELLENGWESHDSIKFLYSKLKKFNVLLKEEKIKYLDKFCTLILREENEFTESLNSFRRLKNLKEKLEVKSKKSKFKMKFVLWESIDVDLLAVYNAETYLTLEEIYTNLSKLEMNMNHEGSIKEVHDILINQLEPIIVAEEKKLKKTLSKTNRFFSGV